MTDEELMLAVCSGDQSAYQTLVRQHVNSISRYAYRMLGNRKDTEDITQEVFLKLWTNASKWQANKSKLTTWLHRITHNLCIDYLRKHSRVETKEDFEAIPDDGLFEINESTSAEEQERAKSLNFAISELPENQRSALMLCHYAGFSNKEAADIMNVSLKALESSIARARRSLRATLEHNEKMRGDTETIG